MRYSRIMRTWFLMSCYWRILFQKVQRIAIPLFCGKQCPTRAKHDTIDYLSLCWVWSNLVTLIEKLIMLSRSRTLTLYIYLLLLHWGYTKTHFPSTQKCSTPTLGVNTKNMLDRFIHQINAPSSYWYISQSIVAEKRHGAM